MCTLSPWEELTCRLPAGSSARYTKGTLARAQRRAALTIIKVKATASALNGVLGVVWKESGGRAVEKVLIELCVCSVCIAQVLRQTSRCGDGMVEKAALTES